jgi:uncharacterized membrane protein
MSASVILTTLFLSLLPISELRGAIPYAYFNGVPLAAAYGAAVIANALVAPLVFLFLDTLHLLFYRIGIYRSIFERTVSRARRKLEPKVARFGYIGVMLFIAVPLPITGAYTGTLGAWILGLNRRKTILAAVGGVVISGLIISAILLAGKGSWSLFIKSSQPH